MKCFILLANKNRNYHDMEPHTKTPLWVHATKSYNLNKWRLDIPKDIGIDL